MIDPRELHNGSTLPSSLTTRQQDAAELVSSYMSVAREMPSSGWLARRMNISRQRAHRYLEVVRAKALRREKDK